MLPLEKMLDVRLLMNDRKSYRTANIFGFIAYTECNPYIVKVLRDDDFWQSLNDRTEGWILYAIKPGSQYYGGGNAKYINDSLGINPEEYPQFVILSIGSKGVIMQRNYPICGNSVETAYNSIEDIVRVVTEAVKKILPEYKGATSVSREVWNALDAELATQQWKRVSASLMSFVQSISSFL